MRCLSSVPGASDKAHTGCGPRFRALRIMAEMVSEPRDCSCEGSNGS